MDYFEEILKDPSTCNASTFKIKQIKKGVKLRMCKDAQCVKDNGIQACKMAAQAILRDKEFYTIDPEGRVTRKEQVDFFK